MTSKTLLNEWYGYDRKVKRLGPAHQYASIGADTFELGKIFKMPKELLDELKSRYSDEEVYKAVQLYFPASDGLTDDDFLTWLDDNGLVDSENIWGHLNWRFKREIEGKPLSGDYSFDELIQNFFNPESPRSDRIFRAIEINEFLHRGQENQTFKDFLLTDSQYEEKCRNFEFHRYSDLSTFLINHISPAFLEFGNKVQRNTRNLLLPLTRTELEKVLDVDNNPYTDSNSEYSHTFEFAELYIQAALGKVKRIHIPALDHLEVSKVILIELMSGPREYWEKRANNSGMVQSVYGIMQYVRSMRTDEEAFTRHFAYLASRDILRELNPLELIAVIVGYEKSRLWTEPSKGKSTLELATEIMYEGKLEPLVFAKLIAHIIINNLNPIVIDKSFDWSSIDSTTPIDWFYETLPHSKLQKLSTQPSIIKNMLIL